MATEWTLPNLGESVKSGTLAQVLVSVGDTIEEGQDVLELETDKAILPVPATVSGVVQEIHVKTGDKLEPGAKVFTVDSGANGAAPVNADAGAAPSGNAGGDSQKADLLGGMGAEQQETTSLSNGAGSNGSGSNGGGAASSSTASNGALQQQAVERGTVTDEPERVVSNAPAQRDGYTSHTAPGGASQNGASTQTAPATTARSGANIPAAPSVRRLARELGVDIGRVQGTGPSGRISFGDVRSFLQTSTQAAPSNGVAIAAAPLPDFSKWGEVERQPISGIGRATAEQMARSWATVPHVTQFDKADVTELEKLRKQFGAKTEKAGGKLTVTAIALKVVASALQKFPQFNASIDMAANEIVMKKYVHVGVAVDTERGLVVPVIRDVDKKNIVQLSVELTQLGEKARARKTSLDEMQGGSFTITNLGGIGGTSFTPIVNTPEVAILGMSRSSMEPVWNGSAFEPRLMLPLSLSYDHRVINGADGARFLRWIAQALEQPFLLSLEG
ncbi:MAG TPA: 2-oxo acid dehydrogenase subunit E2 [Abditibacteriaceae bacterium]|jgi:pyruvate dehydrogenase E2 component (dihydrolipoamide acetyltransferase)